MKTVTVTFLARDDQDLAGINADLESCGVLNDWPVCAWNVNDATPEQAAWFADEYESALDFDEGAEGEHAARELGEDS